MEQAFKKKASPFYAIGKTSAVRAEFVVDYTATLHRYQRAFITIFMFSSIYQDICVAICMYVLRVYFYSLFLIIITRAAVVKANVRMSRRFNKNDYLIITTASFHASARNEIHSDQKYYLLSCLKEHSKSRSKWQINNYCQRFINNRFQIATLSSQISKLPSHCFYYLQPKRSCLLLTSP